MRDRPVCAWRGQVPRDRLSLTAPGPDGAGRQSAGLVLQKEKQEKLLRSRGWDVRAQVGWLQKHRCDTRLEILLAFSPKVKLLETSNQRGQSSLEKTICLKLE